MPTLTPYNKDGLKIVFSLNKVPDSNCLMINVMATNHTLSNMTDFLFQVAVPRVRTQRLIKYYCIMAFDYCLLLNIEIHTLYLVIIFFLGLSNEFHIKCAIF